MKRHTLTLAMLAGAAATATAVGFAVGPAASAAPGATSATATSFGHDDSLPQQVFAPYYETYDLSGDMAQLSQQSGAHFLSLAFLETAQSGSCTAYWDGTTTQPIASTSFGSDIAAIQARGGNVIPSFGGFTADTTNTEIADSCTSVPAIASVYEALITTYNVPRIDMDIEGDSVNNTAGIDRRNKAIAMAEQWAAAHHRHIQFSYTLPTFPTGLPPAELGVLQNAIANGARISTVNLLTFDYFIGTQQDMLANTKSAASALVGQLQTLHPDASQRELWHMVGVTEMPGIDDFGPDETYSQSDAIATLLWAEKNGVGTLSFWALQRDNGGCPGTKGAGTCSGITQPTWFFSHVFEFFSR